MDSLTIACHAAALAQPGWKRPTWAGPEYRVLKVHWNTVGPYSRLLLDVVPGVHVSVSEYLGLTKIVL